MCMSLDLSADKLSCHNSLLWSMCASVCHARGISAFLCLITSHVWTFSQCVGVCHAKAFSVPCLIAASLYLVSTGGFVMQCTGKWCLPNMRFSKPRQQLQHATLHYQQCCTEEELPLNAGYSQVQSTKPQSLGYSLNDSPVGLLAWMVEKFRTWSDRRNTNGQLPFSKDFLSPTVACTGSLEMSPRASDCTMKPGMHMRAGKSNNTARWVSVRGSSIPTMVASLKPESACCCHKSTCKC